jgi:hypothetical protein
VFLGEDCVCVCVCELQEGKCVTLLCVVYFYIISINAYTKGFIFFIIRFAEVIIEVE